MKAKEYALRHELRFGKYHGIKMRYVIDKDPNYIKWLLKEALITLDEEADKYYQNRLAK